MQIASFLGYMYHGGLKSEHILLVLAKVTRFAPLVVNLYRLIEKRPITYLNILAITAPLYTLFRSMLPTKVKNEDVFEYTLNFMSIFDMTLTNEYLKIFELDTQNENDCKEMKEFARYCANTKQQQHVIVWTADTINPDFKAMVMDLPFDRIENFFATVTTFKPVAPLSLHYIFYPTFIRQKDEKNVMLFIKEVPEKENFVLIIDPNKGKKEEINIEELARMVNVETKEEVFSLVNRNQVDQIIFICFDESASMKWKLEGGNAHNGEETRAMLASEFLKALVKQSFSLRVSSFYGLISFGSEVKILQPLTAMTSEFISKLKEIKPSGKTVLYDAINTAQQEIIKLVHKYNKISTRYPNARHRIIVITDGEDNKSKSSPVELVNELIKNDIVVDTVLVSLVEKSEGCCAISKLTGGLCFMPKNLEDGIEIFEQEAFLNIKMRHMNPLPYNDQITEEIFINETEDINNKYLQYPPNQMIINANSNVALATPMYMSYISLMKKIETFRFMRAFIELNIIAKNPNPDSYIVYSLYSTPEEWRIFIKGPKNTPFTDKWLNLYMVLPSNYPYEPPRFRFLTIPFHPNISSEGTVLFSLNDRDYTFSLGIDSIITGIINLLKKPEENYAINRKAIELYNKNNGEFEKRQQEGITGCNDYHEYLQDVKIYNEIPDNIDVPEEDRSTSRVVSITNEAVNNEALKQGQVQNKFLLDINDYENVEQLGSGSFGYVFLVNEKSTSNKFAAKIPKRVNGMDDYIDYVKQVNVIANFNHGAITKLYGYCLNDFNGNDKRVIIMEYISNGDLESIINDERNTIKREGWDDTQKLIVLYGIAAGMDYSVSYGITHSDLKPENILMTNNLLPKISDFDSARLESEEYRQSFNRSGFDLLSPLYMAPEILLVSNYERFAEKSDVYSYSMIAYQVITLLVPFPGIKEHDLYEKITQGTRPFIPGETPPHYANLIISCWKPEPERRPTFKQIVNMLKSDEFLNDKRIDRERFERYVNYLDNYKSTVTESKLIRPIRHVDQFKNGNNNDVVDEVLVHSSAMNINIINLEDFNKENEIGNGRYSQVFRIEQKKDRFIFAAKISLELVSSEVSRNILSELTIMKGLNHPSVLKFVGYSPVNFENQRKPTIVTEYAWNGSLQDVIDNATSHNKFDDTKRLIAIFGIAAGMAYLHKHSILHNDLKPSNILLDERFYPKIADFGFSQNEMATEWLSSESITIKGTPSYVAPEIWSDQKYSKASDVYSFGILLYELVFMKRAFQGLKPVQIGFKVSQNDRPYLPFLTTNVYKSLIKKCWAQNPENRPTFNEILNELKKSKYITKNVKHDDFMKYVQLIENSV